MWTPLKSDKSKDPVPIEIDVKRVNNVVNLSLVITNKSPEKGPYKIDYISRSRTNSSRT